MQHPEAEYPERSAHESRASSRDPRAQSRWGELPDRTDYLPPQPVDGQKIYPVRRRRRWLWLLVIIVPVLVVLLLAGFAAVSSVVSFKTTSLPQRTFKVAIEPQLVINDAVGGITIHTGSSDSVQVNVTERTNSWNNPPQLQYTAMQSGNTIKVDLNVSGTSSINFGAINLDIALPPLSDIQATLDAGNVNIAGVSGLMNIQTNAGNIDFLNGMIKGSSSFRASAGSITFNGSLAARGNYEFNTGAGSVNLTLPADSAFMLDASSDVNSVNNEFGSNTVGDKPTSYLRAHTDAGSVNIHKR
ncbi:MAG TPA: hypothetical protein VGD98_16195 [Ktedonobacteraceae bacterium]